MDAAHFVHEAYLGNVWSREPLYIPSPSGKNRYNVLGALNAITQEIVTVNNDSYINSDSVGQLLAKLAARRCIIAGGLLLGIIGLSIELIDHRILPAKVLCQQVKDAAADAMYDLRELHGCGCSIG